MGKTPGQKAARVKGFKMSESEILRKIAVIFVTDVVGFSTLMAQNEELTLRSFRSCKEILDNLVEEHSGRIFNTAGDSVLAEFPSAVSAVICAVEFQKLIKARNASVPNAAQMQFRIGLNMGDVIIEGTNLYGDGVNVAARLEALSQLFECYRKPVACACQKVFMTLLARKWIWAFKILGRSRLRIPTCTRLTFPLAGWRRARSRQRRLQSNPLRLAHRPRLPFCRLKI
jgi:class 3 adenylate cyclase